MPCLSLRHHSIFARLCHWVDAARPHSDPDVSAELVTEVAPSITPAIAAAGTVQSEPSVNTLAEQDSNIQDLSTQVIGDTLYISHAAPALLIISPETPSAASTTPPSQPSDNSLAALVDAKLAALHTDQPSTTEVANPAVNQLDSLTAEANSSTVTPLTSAQIKHHPNFRLPFASLFNQLSRPTFARQLSQSDLLNAESRLGSTIFGPIPAGHRREFFHDKQNIWIWHESWPVSDAEERQITVRYEVRPTGVYKKFAAGQYVKLENAELDNFRRAAHAYLQVVKAGLYSPAA